MAPRRGRPPAHDGLSGQAAVAVVVGEGAVSRQLLAEMAVLWPFHFKDGPQGKEPLQIGRRSAVVTRVACHPSDDALAVGYADGAVAIARIPGGEFVLVREAGDGPVSALNWDHAGLRLAFGTEEGMAGVIDIRSG